MSCFSKIFDKSQDFISLKSAVDTRRQPIGALGLSHIHKVHLIKSLCDKTNSRALIITGDDASATKMYEDLSAFGVNALLYPSRDFIFRDTNGVSHEYEHIRLGVLSKTVNENYGAVICSIEAAMQYTMPPYELLKRTKKLKVEDEIKINELVSFLLLAGYSRTEQVDGVSRFSVRGGIVDFFPAHLKEPVRVEFWGDTVDTISHFDVDTQRRTDNIDSVEIVPATEVLFDSNEEFIKRIENYSACLKGKAVKAREQLLRDIDKLKAGQTFYSLDKYLPLAYPENATIFDYCADALLFVSDTAKIKDRVNNGNALLNEEIKEHITTGVLSAGLDKFTLDFNDVVNIYNEYSAIYLDTFARGSFDTPVCHLANFKCQQLSLWGGMMGQLNDDLKPLMDNGYTTVVMAGTERNAAAVNADLEKLGYNTVYYSELPDEFQKGAVNVINGKISAGFQYSELKFALFSYSRGGASEKKKLRAKAKNANEKVHSLEELHNGDYIVHNIHGIGIFSGINALELNGVKKDYIKISYAKGDTIYVPVTQLDLVSKYIGPGGEDAKVKINRLGSGDWQKTRNRVKSAVKNMAKELIKLYAQRMSTKGYAFKEDGELQRDFELRFEFDETDDQLRCVEEIKQDMERVAPMDRLLCGDVGFGKTEVALRAAFKCISEGKQCAILVPTTLLAMQHYQTAMSRMESYPINIEMISRYRTPAQQKVIKESLKKGKIDLIIGTHRIISKDIKFHDLGLLIVDEEQRFGVGQKEKLKEKFPAVDVLTLSATPIPRTLNMAMSGIRDMSLLEEAPQDRHPVQTYVIEYDLPILAEAMQKELSRGGQCYFLHNNTETIELRAMQIKKLIPDANVAVGHGKMTKEQLNSVWEQVLEGEIDILVCTTIIETGVDVANANTLIIENADKMGLAQLHQIRGRVGRSSRRASAYLTFTEGKELSEIAQRRLTAISEYTEFGSGFKIAMRDLEIRGAGNVLGAQQHGHMEAVGYDMYLKLLEEAVKIERGELPENVEEKECLIDLQINAHIPESYIKSTPHRLAVYRKIAQIKTQDDVSDVYDELIDRFGEPPQSVQGLVEVSLLRNMAIMADVYEVGERNGSVLIYTNDIDMKRVAFLNSKMRGRVLVSAGKKPYISVKRAPKMTSLDTLRETLEIMLSQKEEN